MIKIIVAVAVQLLLLGGTLPPWTSFVFAFICLCLTVAL